MKELNDLITLFDLRESEQRVYEKLFTEGGMGAGELSKKIGLSRPSVYDVAGKLIKKGLVIQTLRSGISFFAPQQLSHIKELIDEKQKQLTRSKKSLQSLRETESHFQQTFGPRLQIFEGREAVQQMWRSIFQYSDISMSAYLPIKDVMNVLTPTFFEQCTKKRIRSNMPIRVIWPHKQIPSLKKHPFLAPDKDAQREVRIAPAGADFTLGYTIYGNTVRFLSSHRENYGFLVESYELVKTMQSQFDIIWKLSKPVPVRKMKKF